MLPLTNALRHLSLTNSVPIRCVGTYHKTGTVWMMRVFKEIARELGVEFIDLSGKVDFEVTPKAGNIYFHDHSRFPPELFRKNVRGFRVVRDPRDVVISGAHYHSKSTETWLHEPRDEFEGKTYSEMMNGIASMDDRYRLEMVHVAKDTILDMVHFTGNQKLNTFLQKRLLTIKYEHLIEDVELMAFREICSHMRIPFKNAGPIFKKHSLFGGRVEQKGHVRSGKRQQWRSIFDRRLALDFCKEHQSALEMLGYEDDCDWVDNF